MTIEVDIAVVGATGLIGNAVLEHLVESEIQVGQLYPLASEDSEAESVTFGNRQLSVHTLNGFDFSKVQLCFFCTPTSVVAEYIDQAVAANCYCIDFSNVSRLKDNVPLVVTGINDDELQELEGKVVANPDSSVAHLAALLSPLKELEDIERVNVTLMRAVSEYGRKAIDELSEQSIALFNLKPIKTNIFSKQIAFNILPHACHTQAGDDKQDFTSKLEQELRKVLRDDVLSLNSSLTQVPVFFGHSMTIQLEFAAEVPIQKVSDMINKTSDLHLIDQELNSPNVISDAVNQPGIYIGSIRRDPTWSQGINLWTVADNINQGAAINGVKLAEILVKDYL